MARNSIERNAIDVGTWKQKSAVADPEKEDGEPFVNLVKRIIESLILKFQEGESKLQPSIAELMKVVQVYCEIQEDEVPSEVHVIWRDPFATGPA